MAMTRRAAALLRTLFCCSLAPLSAAVAQGTSDDAQAVVARADSVTVRLVDVDVRAAVQALARYIDRPVIFGAVTAGRVTLETPVPVPRERLPQLLRGLLESQGLEMVEDTTAGLFRVRAKEQPRPVASDPFTPPQASRPQAGVELFVVRLRHARAADVAATVNALYGRGALGERGPPAAGSLSDQLRNNLLPPQQSGGQIAASPRSASTNAVLSGEITLVPDPGSNSLLIRTSREDFERVQAAITALDVRPLQALIEVVIVEARRDRGFSFGVDARAPETGLPGAGDGSIRGSTIGGGLGDFVLEVMNVGAFDIDATLRAAASRGEVKIVSRPVIIAANNEDAEILVGSQRPFVQVQRSLPTDAPSRDQVVQYKDVGTRLSVRPTISADGYIALSVMQEVNSATSETAFDAPVISTRTVETDLVVKDRQTVVLGGLTDRQRDRSQGGVPVLSSIPLLGGLFGRASRRTTETELFLFMTPRIIRTDDDVDAITDPLRERAKKAEP
jgi:general secretion pathway protein D